MEKDKNEVCPACRGLGCLLCEGSGFIKKKAVKLDCQGIPLNSEKGKISNSNIDL